MMLSTPLGIHWSDLTEALSKRRPEGAGVASLRPAVHFRRNTQHRHFGESRRRPLLALPARDEDPRRTAGIGPILGAQARARTNSARSESAPASASQRTTR